MDRTSQLEDLKKSLLGIISAITQTPSCKVKKARLATNIATAKFTGIGASAGISGLVYTFGTAGTGTAISGLSGAAANSATLAWIGNLVGGGMAAGAVLLPAAGIAVGVAATTVVRRKIHGRQRKLDELLPFEDEILFCADNLIQPLEAILKEEILTPLEDELRVYAHDGLIPLVNKIRRHINLDSDTSDQASNDLQVATNKERGVDDGDVKSKPDKGFSSTLKPKYQKQLKKHCDIISKYADIFSLPVRKPLNKKIALWFKQLWAKIRKKPKDQKQRLYVASVVLAVTFQRLLEDSYSVWNLEQGLVLDALRRSTKRLEGASVQELSNYVKDLSPEQLKGVVSNTKGIYHELLFVEGHNSVPGADSASVMEATNHPGADVQFHMDGELVREVQLKAISSPSSVYEHLERYPDVDILVTEEVATILEGVDSSGLSNAILSKDVRDRLSELQGDGILEELTDGIMTSAFVTSGVIVYRVLKTKNIKKTDFKSYLSNAGIAAGTASLIDWAISWGSS